MSYNVSGEIKFIINFINLYTKKIELNKRNF